MALKTTVQAALDRLAAVILAANSSLRQVEVDPSGGQYAEPFALLFLSEIQREIRRPTQWRQVIIPVRIQAFVQRWDTGRGNKLAREIALDIIDALDADITLAGTVAATSWEATANTTGGGFQLARLTWAGVDYYGLDGIYSLYFRDSVTYA